MFPITITLHNIAQLTAVMNAIGATGVVLDESTPVKTPKAEAPGKPSAAPTAPSQPTAEAASSQPAPSAAAPESKTTATEPAAAAPSAPADDKPFDYTVLQKAVNERVAKFGKDALLAIATKHGAATFKALDPSKWAAAHADVVALG